MFDSLHKLNANAAKVGCQKIITEYDAEKLSASTESLDSILMNLFTRFLSKLATRVTTIAADFAASMIKKGIKNIKSSKNSVKSKTYDETSAKEIKMHTLSYDAMVKVLSEACKIPKVLEELWERSIPTNTDQLAYSVKETNHTLSELSKIYGFTIKDNFTVSRTQPDEKYLMDDGTLSQLGYNKSSLDKITDCMVKLFTACDAIDNRLLPTMKRISSDIDKHAKNTDKSVVQHYLNGMTSLTEFILGKLKSDTIKHGQSVVNTLTKA